MSRNEHQNSVPNVSVECSLVLEALERGRLAQAVGEFRGNVMKRHLPDLKSRPANRAGSFPEKSLEKSIVGFNLISLHCFCFVEHILDWRRGLIFVLQKNLEQVGVSFRFCKA